MVSVFIERMGACSRKWALFALVPFYLIKIFYLTIFSYDLIHGPK